MVLVKDFIRSLCPPILLKVTRKLRGANSLSFEGNYASWAAAQQFSNGYDAEEVLRRVCESALKVKKGEALFERDAVCFYSEEYRWPTLSCILAVAAERNHGIHVLDFGGALGSFYLQHKKFLSKLENMTWSVVEQSAFVKWGNVHIQTDRLHFYESIPDCIERSSVDLVFLSSVLQYLESPYSILKMLAETNAPYLLIDRTPVIEEDRDRLTVQRVPDAIYKGSYPAWFFSRRRLEDAIGELGYRLIIEFSCDEDVGIGEFKGAFYERI